MTFYPLATETWDKEEYEALQRVIDSNRFTMGDEVKAFEEDFSRFFGSRYAVMVNSGSSANLLAIASLVYHPDGLLKPGDTVIVPAVSWGTTYFPLQQCGLKLRFVDIDPDTLNMSPELLEAAIEEDTKAVLAVSLLGNPCEFARIKDICKHHDLLLIEDNCESMGAKLDGQYTGTFGICGTFSSFFSHHISTMEGGMVITDDEQLFHVMISMRAHGWVRGQPAHSHLNLDEDPFTLQFRFVLPGYNLRPLEMSGALGRAQLKKLPGLIEQRRKNAEHYKSVFKDCPDVRLQVETGESSWFGFALTLKGRMAGRRAELAATFKQEDIECRPVVTGNFLNNPVIEHMDYSLGSKIIAAEVIDKDGLFLGNHHFPVKEQLVRSREIIERIARS